MTKLSIPRTTTTNLPRYIDTYEAEDKQDIDGHLRGGIPTCDIAALDDYWQVCPDLRSSLFANQRSGYVDLAVEKTDLKGLSTRTLSSSPTSKTCMRPFMVGVKSPPSCGYLKWTASPRRLSVSFQNHCFTTSNTTFEV